MAAAVLAAAVVVAPAAAAAVVVLVLVVVVVAATAAVVMVMMALTVTMLPGPTSLLAVPANLPSANLAGIRCATNAKMQAPRRGGCAQVQAGCAREEVQDVQQNVGDAWAARRKQHSRKRAWQTLLAGHSQKTAAPAHSSAWR